MVKGILTFRPLKSGGVSILVEGKTSDVPALASLYGREVVIMPVDEAPDQGREALFKEIRAQLERIEDFITSEEGQDAIKEETNL